MQVNASSLGISPIKASYGPLAVKKQHMLVASYSLVKPDDAIVMSHAHTFDGRYTQPTATNLCCSLHKPCLCHMLTPHMEGVVTSQLAESFCMIGSLVFLPV